ncbi:MAG: DNA replication/repair protein RecF [Chloroflexi bacterium]|nr:DNA replication/repair protein RecF [Chloroflexota bacterium]
MILNSLSLTNFRNYVRLEITLPPHITILQGNNAQGKTNLLEAIYYLSTATSPRAETDRQLIHWLAERDVLPFARLVGQVTKGGEALQVEITLMKGQNGNSHAELTQKGIRVNGVNRRVSELIGAINAVLFLPQDIQIVDGSPSHRRRYLNTLLCQIDPRYYRALHKYGQVAFQRNHLLRRLRDRRQDPEQLSFWDRQMVETGAYLLARRLWLVGRLNEVIAGIHPDLTGQQEHLRLAYESSVELAQPARAEDGLQLALSLEAEGAAPDVARLRQAFEEQLAAKRPEEIARGASLLGPHRDDLRFLVNGTDMTIYGSRGQQRTAALSAKLAEVEWLHQETGEMPILLLDDMVSELDPARRNYLLAMLARAQQAIVTTTDIEGFSPEFLQQATLYTVREGQLEPASLP